MRATWRLLPGAYDIDVMGAACFLGNWLLPLERGEELSVPTVGDVLDDLLSAPYPDALDALVFRGGRRGRERFRALRRAIFGGRGRGVREGR